MSRRARARGQVVMRPEPPFFHSRAPGLPSRRDLLGHDRAGDDADRLHVPVRRAGVELCTRRARPSRRQHPAHRRCSAGQHLLVAEAARRDGLELCRACPCAQARPLSCTAHAPARATSGRAQRALVSTHPVECLCPRGRDSARGRVIRSPTRSSRRSRRGDLATWRTSQMSAMADLLVGTAPREMRRWTPHDRVRERYGLSACRAHADKHSTAVCGDKITSARPARRRLRRGRAAAQRRGSATRAAP
jgi:hypothetical protein